MITFYSKSPVKDSSICFIIPMFGSIVSFKPGNWSNGGSYTFINSQFCLKIYISLIALKLNGIGWSFLWNENTINFFSFFVMCYVYLLKFQGKTGFIEDLKAISISSIIYEMSIEFRLNKILNEESIFFFPVIKFW